jgi:HD-GYP domain-containing protein (c-di-GMP phosphodiesterase class II)
LLNERRTVLVVDRDRCVVEDLALKLRRAGFDVLSATTIAEALRQLSSRSAEVILSESEFIQGISTSYPALVPILMAEREVFDSTAERYAHGVYDRVLKPLDTHEVIRTVGRALEKRRLEEENRQLRDHLSLYDPNDSIRRTLSSCQVLKLTLETTYNLLKPEAAVLFLRDALTGRYEIRDFCARDPKVLAEVVGTPDLTALESAVRREPFVSAEGDRIDFFFRRKPTFGKLDSFFSAPVRSGDHLVGFINVYHFDSAPRATDGQLRLLAALATRAAGALHEKNLFENLRETFKQTIHHFAQALDRKDSYTAGHSDRTRIYVSMILDGLKMSAHDKELILDASKLHDIGKLSVDLSTLNNPGRLSPEEIRKFRAHTAYGREILEPIFFFSELLPLVYYHHENLDGSGYPEGIRGEQIPLGARIIAIADSYDAMTSNRAYRRAMDHGQAIREIKKNAGTQFDGAMAEIFLEQVERQLDEREVRKLLGNLAA